MREFSWRDFVRELKQVTPDEWRAFRTRLKEIAGKAVQKVAARAKRKVMRVAAKAMRDLTNDNTFSPRAGALDPDRFESNYDYSKLDEKNDLIKLWIGNASGAEVGLMDSFPGIRTIIMTHAEDDDYVNTFSGGSIAPIYWLANSGWSGASVEALLAEHGIPVHVRVVPDEERPSFGVKVWSRQERYAHYLMRCEDIEPFSIYKPLTEQEKENIARRSNADRARAGAENRRKRREKRARKSERNRFGYDPRRGIK